MNYLFTSESVSEGHPDKICDCISDALLDLHLTQDPYARTAIETLATTNRVIIAGETCCHIPISHEAIDTAIRQCIRQIGYQQAGFDWRNVQIENLLHAQSCDIALGVDQDGAGDQGIMFGYAKKEPGFESQFMPLAIYQAHQILRQLRNDRNLGKIVGLEPDAKSQITLRYENGRPIRAESIVVSTQHQAHLSQSEVREVVIQSLCQVIPPQFMPPDQAILINPTGRFVVGGPDGDTGLTGRKIIVDTYGGYAPHGGGAFSGKDPTKVDRSAAYFLRWLAKNIVAAGLANECLLQVSYAIGHKEPLSLYIDCRQSNQVDESKLLETLKEMLDFTPRGIIQRLDLRRPIYNPTSSYGHFGRAAPEDGTFPWEKLDLVEELKKCF